MARSPKYTTDQILDAAGEVVLEHWRGATIAHVVQHLGIPIGSIYHRFPSRDALFGALWERSIRRFHEGLIIASDIEDGQQAMAALTRHVPQFCRDHPVDAKAMTLYRHADLIEHVPESERSRLATINDEVGRLLEGVVERRFGRMTPELFHLAMIATRLCPYGMIRPFIGGFIPLEFDELCVAAAKGILATGDQRCPESSKGTG